MHNSPSLLMQLDISQESLQIVHTYRCWESACIRFQRRRGFSRQIIRRRHSHFIMHAIPAKRHIQSTSREWDKINKHTKLRNITIFSYIMLCKEAWGGGEWKKKTKNKRIKMTYRHWRNRERRDNKKKKSLYTCQNLFFLRSVVCLSNLKRH